MVRSNQHGGYRNYTEWKKKDPKSYWEMVEGREEKMKPMIDEELGRLVASFGGPKTEWDRTVAAAISGKPVIDATKSVVCKEIPEFIARAVKEEEVVEVIKKDRWFTNLWNWIKKLFGVKKEQDINPMSQPVNSEPVNRGIQINQDFDMDEWISENMVKVREAIKKDGKLDGEIVCPVCYKKRLYAVMDDESIKTTCEGCCVELR